MRIWKWFLALQNAIGTLLLLCCAIMALLIYLCVLFLLASAVILWFLLLVVSGRHVDETILIYDMECCILSVLRTAKYRPHPLSFGWMLRKEIIDGVHKSMDMEFNNIRFSVVLQSLEKRKIVVYELVSGRYVSGCDSRQVRYAYNLRDDSYRPRRPKRRLKKEVRDVVVPETQHA